jgi:hypothetical protein
LINFDHPDTGIIWGLDSEHCVIIDTIEVGSPASQIQQLIHGLRLVRLNEHHIEAKNNSSLSKLLHFIVSLPKNPIEYEFLEPILVITSFGNIIDVQIDHQIYSIELPIGAVYDLILFQKVVQAIIERTHPKLVGFEINIHETKRQISFTSSIYSFKLLFGSGPNYHRSCRFALGFQAIDYPISNQVIGQIMGISLNLGLDEKQLTELTKELFKQFDKDESGQLDFEEFRDFYVRFFNNEESIETLTAYAKFRYRDKEVEAYWHKKQKEKFERRNRKKEARLLHQKTLTRQQMKFFAQSVLSSDGLRRRQPNKLSSHSNSSSASSVVSGSMYSSQMTISIADSPAKKDSLLPPMANNHRAVMTLPKKKLPKLSPIKEYKHNPRKEFLHKTMNAELEIALRLSYQHLIRLKRDLHHQNLMTVQLDIRPWIATPALILDAPIFQYMNHTTSPSTLTKAIELNSDLSFKILHPGIMNYYMIKEEAVHSINDSSLCHPVFFNADYQRNDESCQRHTSNSMLMCQMLDEECDAGRIYRRQYQVDRMNQHAHVPQDEQNIFRSMLQRYQRMKEYQSSYFQNRIRNDQMLGRITISSIIFSMKRSIFPVSIMRRASIHIVISRFHSLEQQHRLLNQVSTDHDQHPGNKFTWQGLHYQLPIESGNIIRIDIYDGDKLLDQVTILSSALESFFAQTYEGEYHHSVVLTNGHNLDIAMSFEYGDEYDWHVHSHQFDELQLTQPLAKGPNPSSSASKHISFPIRLKISSLIVYDITFSSWNLLSKALVVEIEVDEQRQVIDYSKYKPRELEAMNIVLSMISLLSALRITVSSMVPIKELIGQYFIMAHEIIALPINPNGEVVLYGTIKNQDKDVGHITMLASYESIIPPKPELIKERVAIATEEKNLFDEKLADQKNDVQDEREENEGSTSSSVDVMITKHRPANLPRLETNHIKQIKEDRQRVKKSMNQKTLPESNPPPIIEQPLKKKQSFLKPAYIEEGIHDIEKIVYNRETQSNLQLVENYHMQQQAETDILQSLKRINRSSPKKRQSNDVALNGNMVRILHLRCMDLLTVHRNHGKNSPKLHIVIDNVLKENTKPIPYGGSNGSWDNLSWKLPDIDAVIHPGWNIKAHITSNQTFIGRMKLPLGVLYEKILSLKDHADEVLVIDNRIKIYRDQKDRKRGVIILECDLESDIKSNRGFFNKSMSDASSSSASASTAEAIVTGKLQVYLEYQGLVSAHDDMVGMVDGLVDQDQDQDQDLQDDATEDDKDQISINTFLSPTATLKKSSFYGTSGRTPNPLRRVSFADSTFTSPGSSSAKLSLPSPSSTMSSPRMKIKSKSKTRRRLMIATDHHLYKPEKPSHFYARVFVGRVLHEVIRSFVAIEQQESYQPAPLASLDFFNTHEKSLKVVLAENEARLMSLRNQEEIIEEVATMKVKEYVWAACQLYVSHHKDHLSMPKSPRRAGIIGSHAKESSPSLLAEPALTAHQVHHVPDKFRSCDAADLSYQHAASHQERRLNYEKNLSLNNDHSKIVHEIINYDLIPVNVFLRVLRILDIDIHVGSLSPRDSPRSIYITACRPNHRWSIETKSLEVTSHGGIDFDRIANEEGTSLTAGQVIKFHLRNSHIHDSIYASYTLTFESLFTKEIRRSLSSTGMLMLPVNFIPSSNNITHSVIPGFIELSLDFSSNTVAKANPRKSEAFPYQYWRSYVLPPVSVGLTQQKYLDASLEYDHQMRIHPSLFGIKIRWHDRNPMEEAKYIHPLFYNYTLNRAYPDDKTTAFGRAAKGRKKAMVRSERFAFDPFERLQQRCPVCRQGIEGCPRCFMLPENSFREAYAYNPYREKERLYEEQCADLKLNLEKKKGSDEQDAESCLDDDSSSLGDQRSVSSTSAPTTLHTNLTTYPSVRMHRNMLSSYSTIYIKILPSGQIKKILVDNQIDTVYHLYHRFLSIAPHTIGEAPRQPMLIFPTMHGHYELTPTLFHGNSLQLADVSGMKALSKYFTTMTSKKLCLFYFSHHENASSMQYMITSFLLRHIAENRMKSDDLNMLSYYTTLPKQPISSSSDTIQQSILTLLREQYRRQQVDLEVNYYRDLGLRYRKYLKEVSMMVDPSSKEAAVNPISKLSLMPKKSKRILLGQRRKLTIDPVTGKMMWKHPHEKLLPPIHQATNSLSMKLSEKILYDDESSLATSADDSLANEASLATSRSSTIDGLISLPSRSMFSASMVAEDDDDDDDDEELSVSTSTSASVSTSASTVMMSPHSIQTKSSYASSSIFSPYSSATSFSAFSPSSDFSSQSYSTLSTGTNSTTLSTPFHFKSSNSIDTNDESSYTPSTIGSRSFRSFSPSQSLQSSRYSIATGDDDDEVGSYLDDDESGDASERSAGGSIANITNAWESFSSATSTSTAFSTKIRAVHLEL